MKNFYFQKLRAILILFVIFIHTNYESTNFNNYIIIFIRTIANVAVPIFFFLSGYFFNKNKYEKEKLKFLSLKIYRLLIPLLIWNLFYFIINYKKTTIKSFIICRTSGHLYFIVVLIKLVLLTPIILKIFNKNFFKWMLIILTPTYLFIYRFLNLNFSYMIPLHELYVFGWIIYYLLGLKYEEIKNYFLKLANNAYIYMLMITYLFNIFIYNIYGFDFSLSQMNIVNMIFSIITISIIMSRARKDKKENILSKIGDRAIGIYFIHNFILKIVKYLFSMFILNDILKILLIVLFTYFISYYSIEWFSKITKGRFDKILGFI